MQVIAALRRLWRHASFRRLLALRTLSQAADGTLQVGMASYILFSPQSQPDAWAIAGVLALTLLPFTVIGPFVSPLLDRWSRRNVALYSDIARAGARGPHRRDHLPPGSPRGAGRWCSTARCWWR